MPLSWVDRTPLRWIHARGRLFLETVLLRRVRFRNGTVNPGLPLRGRDHVQTRGSRNSRTATRRARESRRGRTGRKPPDFN